MKLRIFCLWLCTTACWSVAVPGGPGTATAANYMIVADVDGHSVEGRPIFWSNSVVQMILRDGQLLEFPASHARNYRRISDRFYPYDKNELRGRLATEFGRDFDVTVTRHYLVVHPKGQQDPWSDRFEDLYRSFVHYFQIRGLRLHEPEYPLVGVVWKNQQDYRNYAAAHGAVLSPNVIGYYSPVSNRVHLFDARSGAGGNRNWQQNATTIIHEVTHQTAFNTGVHARFAGCPRWLAEGLGTLFEARGTYDAQQYPNRPDRINRGRLNDFHHLFPRGLDAAFLAELVATDQPFERDPGRAYAASWAFTFYLVETQSQRYADFLSLTAARQQGSQYLEPTRLADFSKTFGNNFPLLAAHFNQFMAEVR